MSPSIATTRVKRTTPTGRFRAAYIMARLEHAVVQAHGRAAFEGYRSILTEQAKQFARCPRNRRPDREEALRGLERLFVDVVGRFSPAQWTWRPPAGWRPPPMAPLPVVKWWTEERPTPRLQLVP